MPRRTMTRPQIDERLRRILKFVVESYVQSAEPVGSQYVRAAYHLSISPATIRSAMQRLESLGLLDHPHTSAGRVPTEAGYRFYVDELMVPEDLPPATRRAVDAAFQHEEGHGAAPEAAATHALARISRHLALLACRPDRAGLVGRVELVRLSNGYLLLAVGGLDGDLPTTTWRPEPAPDPGLLSHAEAWIRARLPLAGPRDLRALAPTAARELGTDAAVFLEDVLERAARLLEAVEVTAVRMEGAEHIAKQPEFQSAARLRALVTLLTERERLTRVLEPMRGSERVRITIGRENGSGPMGSCSVVAAGIDRSGVTGSLAVLGPVRMPYARLVSLVTFVSGRLTGRG
jgi:heat-inducible transcriptional repressor